MIRLVKRNKIFSFLLILTIISFVGSIFLTAVIDNNIKKEIHHNIIKILDNKEIQIKLLNKGSFISVFWKNTMIILLIWILGISIIGIPIILFFYLLKVLLLAWNIFFLINHLTFSTIPFIVIYLSSSIILVFILFLLSYYAISYSILLFKLLFSKKQIFIQTITKRYIKVFLFCLISMILLSLLEVYILPKLLTFS